MYANDSDEMSFTVSGRDDSLLKILAEKMNFKFKYVDVAQIYSPENNTLPGELGLQMLRDRV
jgi:predicted RNA-binding protein associated with RNAse of E/G family